MSFYYSTAKTEQIITVYYSINSKTHFVLIGALNILQGKSYIKAQIKYQPIGEKIILCNPSDNNGENTIKICKICKYVEFGKLGFK